jgi:hypothetical protein
MTIAKARHDDIEIAYETFGGRRHPVDAASPGFLVGLTFS